MIRLMALIEAATVTGPAKNLLEFCRNAREPKDGGPGVDVSLVTFYRGPRPRRGEPENEFVAAARASGVFVAVLPERGRFDPRVIPLLRQVARRRRPDIVQTHHVKSHFLMRASGLWRARPWVAWHHAYTLTDRKMRVYNQLDRWSLRAPDVVMTVNQPFVRDLERIGVASDRLRVLHNATRVGWNSHVTPQAVSDLRAKLGLAADERVVLAVGRFSHEKGHEDLLQAFARLRQEHPHLPVRLVLVGDGPERHALQASVARLGLGGRVIFAGQQRDVGPFFALADVMALPSLGEGSPNVLLEAISSGLPVVSTIVGGVPEIVTHAQSALLIEPRDVPGMARSLGQVLNDANLARNLTAQALVVAARYSPEARLSALLELYRGLAPDKR